MSTGLSRENLKARLYSFTIPACMDGMIYLVVTALPLLALRFGADAMFLGVLGAAGQLVRLPVCLAAGTLSDRIGRRALIVPAALAATLICFALAFASTKPQLVALNVALMIAAGMYYPALEALIGDKSAPDQLRRNLAAFNLGWSVGGGLLCLLSGYLLQVSVGLPFYVGAAMGVVVLVLSAAWSSAPAAQSGRPGAHGEEQAHPVAIPGAKWLLLASRIGMFQAYFGFGAYRYIFPKLAHDLAVSEGRIGALMSLLVVGTGAGVMLSNMSSWWRGRSWPLVACQVVNLSSALLVYQSRAVSLFAVAFVAWGFAAGVVYTASIYYALHGRAEMGRNAGIHESLTAAGPLAGSLAAGFLAQNYGDRSPYVCLCAASAATIAALIIIIRRRATST